MAVESKSFLENKTFVDACDRAREGNGRLHYLGLVSVFILMYLKEF